MIQGKIYAHSERGEIIYSTLTPSVETITTFLMITNLCSTFSFSFFLRPGILHLDATDGLSSCIKPSEVPRLKNPALKHFIEAHLQAQVCVEDSLHCKERFNDQTAIT